MTRAPTYPLGSGMVFVFGSNRAGIHGAGAALFARRHLGALRGVGEGPMPDERNPRCYALPTKDLIRKTLRPLPLDQIAAHVLTFRVFALSRPDLTFYVTRVGCGLAGYTDVDIAPLFRGAPVNCDLPEGWSR